MPLQASLAPGRIAILSRQPRRVTIAVYGQLHQRLLARADQEGRSLSHLMAHLLEVATAQTSEGTSVQPLSNREEA